MREPSVASIKLIVLFVLLSGIPLAVLGWLAWRLLEQDLTLEVQHPRERLDHAAVLISNEIDRGLSGWEDLLAKTAQGDAAGLPCGTVLVIFDSRGIIQQRGIQLPNYPRVLSAAAASQEIFADAEEQEFRENSCEKATASYRVELKAEAEQRGQWRVQSDREALSLALRNMLDNALKYSPESSTVRVSLECRDGLAGISVQDEGAGIPKEEERAVFRKFVRGAAARTLNLKGTGIGLTMADQIIRAHGGRLELSCKPGHGTHFTILLPLWDRSL